ncbi:MAG: homogentisate 1,2-dioxygenase [Actinobacteria bacterium]|nr:homogentisate 1,2-dioxygenase [Actinomycetota bacterium]MBI3688875.1 homogentisate 1,2-dioxygenase [Actinomycetota bacterium]
MPYYRVVGQLPRKRHTQFRRPDGGLYTEELMGMAGFAGESALLYHEHPPTAIVDSQPHPGVGTARTPNLPLKPRHLITHDLDHAGLDPITGRQRLLANDDVTVSYVAADTPSPLYRNAVGDECLYLEAGAARFESVFGALDLHAGDYLVVPTSTTYRLIPSGPGPLRTFVIEVTGHLGPARRYLTARGQLNESAPYCERDLRGPTEPLLTNGEDVEVLVRHRQGWTTLTYARHPFDVVGWDGCLYPYALNIADFEPLTGRVHQPPPVHQVFEGPNVVVCNFVPRKVDYHPLAVPVPYHHANVDSDEVMFYCGGNYEARRGSGVRQGSISLHPAGLTHGPQPGAAERSLGVEYFDELAVMVDTFRPLDLCEAGQACEDPDYPWSWSARRPG